MLFRSDFVAGSDLLVYVELGNLLSLMEDDGQYRTRHSAVLELAPHGAEVDPVARLEIDEVVDLCRRQRRDYHQAWLFPLDRALPAGPYVLRLTVTDESNRKQVSQTLNLRVQAAPPDEREILERKPVVREEPPDQTLPAPRDPLQIKVREGAKPGTNPGGNRSPAKPHAVVPQDADEPLSELPAEAPPASSADESPEDSPAETSEATAEEDTTEAADETMEDETEESVDQETAGDDDMPPLPPVE